MTVATDLFLFTKMIIETERKTAAELQQLSNVQHHKWEGFIHLFFDIARAVMASPAAGF